MSTIKENFMTKDEALRMAIDLLELYNNHIYRTGNGIDVIKACKEALEQPAWQDLTHDEIDKILTSFPATFKFARAIEAKLKEKNYADNT